HIGVTVLGQPLGQLRGQPQRAGGLVEDALSERAAHTLPVPRVVVAGAFPSSMDDNRCDKAGLDAKLRVGTDDEVVATLGVLADIGHDVFEHFVKSESSTRWASILHFS